MSKFSATKNHKTNVPMRTNVKSAIKTSAVRLPNFEGGDGYEKELFTELFLLAATNMVGEDSYYESASVRDSRYLTLIKAVVEEAPEFILGTETGVGLAGYLRNELLMRSASVVLAAEYVRAGGPYGRTVVNRVLQRPDEPAEMLGYWLVNYGRNIPMAIKRGVADAVVRMYNQKTALKYDGDTKAVRMGDVIELVHPRPRDAEQNALFKFLIDKRHGRANFDNDLLGMINSAHNLSQLSDEEKRNVDSDTLRKAGFTWEKLSSFNSGPVDWEKAIPQMGVMALIRNLRNFDKAEISSKSVDYVISKITDPEAVEKARIFPYQVYAAYKNAPSDNWKKALNETFDLTTKNIPSELDGSLILIDVSGSMTGTVSGKSTMQRWELAAVMAAATRKGTKNTDIVAYGQNNARLVIPAGTSALAVINEVHRIMQSGRLGQATYGHSAIHMHYDNHKRVIMFTDDQQHDSGRYDLSHIPTIYTFDLAGYKVSSMATGEKGRYTLGGFSDATFKIMEILENGRNSTWPFV
jgi:hypothetical protein